MECRYVENEPAPPEAVCEGWIRRRERLPHWDKWAKDKAPNAEVSDRRAHGNENTTGANGGSLR